MWLILTGRDNVGGDWMSWSPEDRTGQESEIKLEVWAHKGICSHPELPKPGRAALTGSEFPVTGACKQGPRGHLSGMLWK